MGNRYKDVRGVERDAERACSVAPSAASGPGPTVEGINDVALHVQAGPLRFAIASVAALAMLVALPGSAQAAAVTVPLGTADSFVVLAGAGITNTGPTTLHGDLGTFPTTTITGAASLTVTGTNHHSDAVTR